MTAPSRERRLPARIVSGGQTGVDRAALDAALAAGLEVGGWCPAGRAAEDGPIAARYPLRETASADPAQRTETNVRESDATLILVADGAWDAGTRLTAEICARGGRPVLVLDIAGADSPARARAFLAAHGGGTVNIAGPRESRCPGIGARARAFLDTVLAQP